MAEILGKAHQTLSKSTDPAVKYFAEILTVLPKQPRDAIPCVEWLGPEKYQAGLVSTPGGDDLGFIQNRPDGLWNITPSRNGPVMVATVAETQTDARCYLATLLTRSTRLVVRNEEKWLRIVGEEHNLFKRNHEQLTNWWEDMTDAEQPTFQVTFWDNTHGITNGDMVRLETPSKAYHGVVELLEGTVTGVKDHEVFVQGMESIGSEW